MRQSSGHIDESDGEFNLIEQAFRRASPKPHPDTTLPNGDDASVHGVPAGMELVVSTDSSIASVHWPHRFPLVQAADRAVCSALSDLAAMGAEARWAWVSVMAASKNELLEMGRGVNAALGRYHVELAGGDTARSPLTAALNVTVAGVLPKGSAMRRDMAKPNEKVWIIGSAGFASLGLKQWMGELKGETFKRHFEVIEPKLEQSLRLRELGLRCCIDVSDGVLQDAGHIAKASGVAIKLELADFPGWISLCEKVGEAAAVQAVAGGGEDYALLFTAPAEMAGLDGLATCVGVCEQGEGVKIHLHGREITGVESGYDHFA